MDKFNRSSLTCSEKFHWNKVKDTKGLIEKYVTDEYARLNKLGWKSEVDALWLRRLPVKRLNYIADDEKRI